MLRMKSKVRIVSGEKSDGRFNFGTIVGIELMQDATYLGYSNEREFLARYTVPRYKVVYVDCVTNRACSEWFNEDELDTKKR